MIDNHSPNLPPITQFPLDAVPDTLYDVLIIGAGPAGASSAIYLSTFGYRVLLVDRYSFPREKVCGDALLADVNPHLDAFGLLDRVQNDALLLSGIHVYSPSRIDFAIDSPLMTLRRIHFDTLLAQRAVEGGAVFALADIRDLKIENNIIHAFAHDHPAPLKARLVIIATGAHISLPRKMKMITSHKPSALAMRFYVRSEYKLDKLILSYDKKILPGYGWIVPLKNNLYNVGCGYYLKPDCQLNLKNQLNSFIANFPLMQNIMKQGKIISTPQSAPLRCELKGAHFMLQRHVMLIGETAGATFPLTGEGIGQALTTGKIVAEVIHSAFSTNENDRLTEYLQRLQYELQPDYDGYKIGQRWVANAFISDLMAHRIKKSIFLQSLTASFIAKKENPQKIYSITSFLKSFWI